MVVVACITVSACCGLLVCAGESGKAAAAKDAMQPFIDFGDDDGDLEEIKRKQDEELDLTGKKMLTSKATGKTPGAAAGQLILLHLHCLVNARNT